MHLSKNQWEGTEQLQKALEEKPNFSFPSVSPDIEIYLKLL